MADTGTYVELPGMEGVNAILVDGVPHSVWDGRPAVVVTNGPYVTYMHFTHGVLDNKEGPAVTYAVYHPTSSMGRPLSHDPIVLPDDEWHVDGKVAGPTLRDLVCGVITKDGLMHRNMKQYSCQFYHVDADWLVHVRDVDGHPGMMVADVASSSIVDPVMRMTFIGGVLGNRPSVPKHVFTRDYDCEEDAPPAPAVEYLAEHAFIPDEWWMRGKQVGGGGVFQQNRDQGMAAVADLVAQRDGAGATGRTVKAARADA
jgi:hypothetical protein